MVDFTDFYKAREEDTLKQTIARSRFMNEESKKYLIDLIGEAMHGNGNGNGMKKMKKKDDDDDDDDDDDMDEANDMSTKEVDKAIKHDCASHVYHEELGSGVCISGQHTIKENADGTGYVTHYDVVFENGMMYENVPVKDLEIVSEANHMHKRKK